VSSTPIGVEHWSWLEWSHASWERHAHGRIAPELAGRGHTVARYVWDTADRYPDKSAVSIDGAGRTFAELRDAVAVVAGWLSERVQMGERVVLVAATSITWVEVYLGALSAGAAVVLVNPSSSAQELKHLVDDSGAVLVIADQGTLGGCVSVGSPAFSLSEHPWAGSVAVSGPREGLAGADLALLAYTSGTTGRPKGVPLTHSQLLASIAAALFSWDWRSEDVVVHALPLYHQHGLGALHAALCTGSSAALLSHFDAVRLAATASAAGATVLFAVPAIYRRLVDVLETIPLSDAAALRALRLRICGSAPLDDDLAADIIDRLGAPALVRYGLTESGLDVSQPLDGAGPGTIGIPLPGVELRLVHDSIEVGTAAEGEIQLRGPQVFDGYWRNPDATAEAVTSDGWLRTGDLAILDAPTAQLRICGRSKELIITGGLNVHPREVELALETHPDVVEAGVAGVPDARWGEQVTAWVVADPGAVLDVAGLMDHVRAQLAPYKCPKQIYVVSALPRTSMGKLQRARLAPPTVVARAQT